MAKKYMITFFQEGWAARVNDRWGDNAIRINPLTVLIREDELSMEAIAEFCGFNGHDEVNGFVCLVEYYRARGPEDDITKLKSWKEDD